VNILLQSETNRISMRLLSFYPAVLVNSKPQRIQSLLLNFAEGAKFAGK